MNSSEYNKAYYKANKEKYKAYNKTYYKENRDEMMAHNTAYKKKHNYDSKWKKNKRIEDPNYRLRDNMRSRVYRAFKTSNLVGEGITHYFDLIGCSVEEAKQHIENQFKPHMTWDNWGAIWEIDHIKPCVAFDLTLESEQQMCFHYTNLQPLYKTTAIARQLGQHSEIGNRDKGDIH